MHFDLTDFAAFDIHIPQRPGATESFPQDIVEAAAQRFAGMDEKRRMALATNVVFGLPGAAEHFTLDGVRAHLAEYADMNSDQLRQHLIGFLEQVVPTAERPSLRLCCHPDDPPFSLLGLPRIMSTEADYKAVMEAVDSPANGITLCSGSLACSAKAMFSM